MEENKNELHELFAQSKDNCFEVGLNKIHLLDPSERRRLSIEEIPAIVLQDEFTKQGLFWIFHEYFNNNLAATLVLGPHGGQEDFESLKASATEVIANADLVAVENEVAALDEKSLEDSPNFQMDFSPVDSPHGIYQRAQFEWLLSHNKIILPCDHKLSTNEGSSLIKELSKTHFRSLELLSSKSKIDSSLGIVTRGLYQFMREWNMLGRIGNQIKTLRERGQIEGRQNLAIVLGSWHLSVVDKIKLLGVDIDTHIVERPDFPSEEDKIRMALYRSGSISFADLETITPGE